ncbi:gliding motility-associated C-terminal domain-containing protein [Tenacibaculum sp. TC6]|uniref:gliding motility-associated C-terminal domain-containing protein n=1 Tax=Tenacibaculum sp. TC6 TaxID=3423223 RepID=UPI003D364C43
MKSFLSTIAIAMPIFLGAQSAFHNLGNIKLHDGANIGFHTDFINDGSLDNNNSGLAGFYSDNEIRSISGNNEAIFKDVEIDAVNDVELYTSLGVTNDMNFVNGKIYTPRNNVNTSLDFINYNLYAGEDNSRHVDGYSSVIGVDNFIFPIGDDNRIRPMILTTQNINNKYSGAYYFNNPNTPPTHFTEVFSTTQKQAFIDNISILEFWDLDGANETKITLTWDNNSNVGTINSDIKLLTVVGWSASEGKWIDLGNSAVNGDINKGQVTSNTFIPDNYTIITIGSHFSEDQLTDVNLIFTPNGDSTNETLVFEGLERYKNNSLSIFNRWGNTVYETTNYKNDWKGKSIGRATINKENDLPVGTYFYTLALDNGESVKNQKGWIYIYR